MFFLKQLVVLIAIFPPLQFFPWEYDPDTYDAEMVNLTLELYSDKPKRVMIDLQALNSSNSRFDKSKELLKMLREAHIYAPNGDFLETDIRPLPEMLRDVRIKVYNGLNERFPIQERGTSNSNAANIIAENPLQVEDPPPAPTDKAMGQPEADKTIHATEMKGKGGGLHDGTTGDL